MMTNKRSYTCPFVLALATMLCLSILEVNAQNSEDETKDWFVSLDVGMQMSGIKSEDFIWSNYSPVYRLSLGKEFSPNFGVQVGYQGRYFRAISDNLRYNYNYFFVEGMLNVTNILFQKEPRKKYNLWFHAGPGYFYHEIYQRSDIHWNIGGSNIFFLSESFNLKLDLSAIIGWDIYQGDRDILPNATLGIQYKF